GVGAAHAMKNRWRLCSTRLTLAATSLIRLGLTAKATAKVCSDNLSAPIQRRNSTRPRRFHPGIGSGRVVAAQRSMIVFLLSRLMNTCAAVLRMLALIV